MAKRILKKSEDLHYRFSGMNHKNCVLRTPSLVDAFTEEVYEDETGNECIRYHDDIYMLFNQQRLAKIMNPADLVAYINSLSKSTTQNMPKMTDEQLFQFIKSRHIQSASELLAWSQYLNDNYSDIIAEIEGGVKDAETSAVAEGTDTNGSEGSN